MTIPSCSPSLAARPAVGRATAAALVASVGLIAAIASRGPAPRAWQAPPAGMACVEMAAPPVRTPVTPAPAVDPAPRQVLPAVNAADVVGIYRSLSCRLTLNASGTYTTDCGDGHAHRYRMAGRHVVLEQGDGHEVRLSIIGRGSLEDEGGAAYAITGRVR